MEGVVSKTIAQKAYEWKCSESTVRRYCASGIIPTAEQVGVRKVWQIPDDCKKPPLTRHGLCFLLDTIYQLNHGARYDPSSWGYAEETIRAGFEYLVSFAFMTPFSWENAESELKGCSVTPRGEELIRRENAESQGKVSFQAHVSAKANLGIASVEADAQMKYE